MEVKAYEIIIERDPMTKVPKVIPAWELDIYQDKYPEKIEISKETTFHVDELPDPIEEADRLRSVLGAEKETGVPHFDNVYGRGRPGVDLFEKAIHAARVRAPKPASAKKEHKEPQAPKDGAADATVDGSGDPPKDALAD